ncbi:hypothetical protein Hamer_G007158 [Homarus americanus]|uniref:Uncharacterized protein n=1 Tax=Homarus americanus TaxID=6706 RepID=A0A8J5JW66_HOMAM|nr:hypothetical protein Hamer_G007158 [Homarus americanus]
MGLRESGSTGDVGYKSCGKSDTRQDSGLTDTTETHGHSGPDLVSASQGGGVSGGSSGGGSSLPFQPQKVTYVPVYDYHHHPQPQGERDWSMGEDVWSGAPGGTAGVGKEQSDTSPLSPYGVVDPRRHSAYLRPLDQLPPQLTQLPTHLTDHQLARQYVPQPHHPPPSTPKLFQPTSEHESSV